MLQQTGAEQNIESEVSAFIVVAATDSAIGQIARLVSLHVPPIEIAFVALVCHASRQRLLFCAPAFRDGLGDGSAGDAGNGLYTGGSLIDQTAKEICSGSFYRWVSRRLY